jgi:hypothetical protein
VKLALIVLIAVMGLKADWAKVMAEPNLERRSELALRVANQEIETARTAYSDDKMDEFRRLVGEVGKLVELSYKSLQDTGKRARRSPKWFKRAELSLRSLLRRVDGLEKDVSAEDREIVAEMHRRVETVHQQLLHDIMTKK